MRHTIFMALVLISPLYGLDSGSRSLGSSTAITIIPTMQEATLSHDVEAVRTTSDHEHHHRHQSHFKLKMAALTTISTAIIAAAVTLGIHFSNCQMNN